MRARLNLEHGSATPADRTLLPGETISLGRGLDNTIVLSDKCASKHHARIFAEGGRWFLRDLESRNGVLLDGRRVRGEAELVPGAEIGFGDVRFRFTAGDEGGATPPAAGRGDPAAGDDSEETVFRPDEMTALYRFLSASLGEEGPNGLVRLALDGLRRQLRADLVGYRGLDADELLIVLPEQEQVDALLSSRLTEKALADGAAVRLADAPSGELTGESLAGLRDALCVPLRDGRDPQEPPLGALHAYRRTTPFTERDVRFCEVLAGCLAGCLRGVRDRRALEADNSRLRLGSPGGDDALVGDSPAVRLLREQIARLADHPGSILITGETGVGKELVALGLHRASRRRAGPLVTVNCASLTPSTAASELFGHAPAAFTGADKWHPGFFQQADGGTLFLDEIGELTPEMQAMLLRVLETRRFRPMKAVEDFTADVRVLAATNRDLEREVRAGRFRPDLFYRFSVAIKLPPLRDHAEDVPALARHFLAALKRGGASPPLHLTEAALERLQAYAWPGNVRQLRYLLEGAAALSRDGCIDAADLHLPEGASGPGDELPLDLEGLEEWAIRRALDRAGGVQKRAAELLGINRDTLIQKMRKYEIGRAACGGE